MLPGTFSYALSYNLSTLYHIITYLSLQAKLFSLFIYLFLNTLLTKKECPRFLRIGVRNSSRKTDSPDQTQYNSFRAQFITKKQAGVRQSYNGDVIEDNQYDYFKVYKYLLRWYINMCKWNL